MKEKKEKISITKQVLDYFLKKEFLTLKSVFDVRMFLFTLLVSKDYYKEYPNPEHVGVARKFILEERQKFKESLERLERDEPELASIMFRGEEEKNNLLDSMLETYLLHVLAKRTL